MSYKNREKKPKVNTWRYDGEIISPLCFSVMWESGDNYENYERKFEIKDKNDFRTYPGKYFGGTLPTSLIESPWKSTTDAEVSLVQDFPACNKLQSQQTIYLRDDSFTSFYDPSDNISKGYRLLYDVPSMLCDELAPHIEGNCHQSYLLMLYMNGGGSKTSIYFYIYGLFKMKDQMKDQTKDQMKIFPLMKIQSPASGTTFIEDWMERAGE
jgi:hypothetical protein